MATFFDSSRSIPITIPRTSDGSRVIDDVIDRFDLLAEQPRMGRPRPEITPAFAPSALRITSSTTATRVTCSSPECLMADAIRPRRDPGPTDDRRNPVCTGLRPGPRFPDDTGNESAASDRIVEECPDAGLDRGTNAGVGGGRERVQAGGPWTSEREIGGLPSRLGRTL